MRDAGSMNVEKRLMVRWTVWAVAAGAVIAAVLTLWLAPVSLKLNDSAETPVVCEPFASGSSQVDLWPYLNEVETWVKDGHGSDAEHRLLATMGMFQRCDDARQNREVALMLTAIGGATLLLLTRPRRRTLSAPAQPAR